eukprot:5329286-Prymnesium_polylepis.1
MQNHASRHDRTAYTDGTHARALAPLASPARWRRSPPKRSTRRGALVAADKPTRSQGHVRAAVATEAVGAGLLRVSCAPARDV